VVGRGSESGSVALCVRYDGSQATSSYRTRSATLPQQQDTIPYAVKISVVCSWWWAKDCPKHVQLILEISKLLLLHLVGSSILLYLHWWCTVKHKSSLEKMSPIHKISCRSSRLGQILRCGIPTCAKLKRIWQHILECHKLLTVSSLASFIM